MKKPTFNHLVNVATDVHHYWAHTDRAKFHYFNSNGVGPQWRAVCEKVAEAVLANRCLSGVLFVHGSLNTHHYDRLYTLATKRKRVDGIELAVVVDSMRKNIREAEAFLSNLPESDGR